MVVSDEIDLPMKWIVDYDSFFIRWKENDFVRNPKQMILYVLERHLAYHSFLNVSAVRMPNSRLPCCETAHVLTCSLEKEPWATCHLRKQKPASRIWCE